jgi:glycosyltransferase involved in cell wall biosynthesis
MLGRRCRVSTLVMISEVHSSPQIFAILKELKNSNVELEVVFFGVEVSPLFRQLRQLECNLILKEPLSKSGIFRNFPFLYLYLMRNRPLIVLCSGFLVSAIAMPLSLLSGVPHRIYIRHHSNLHSRYRSNRGLILDKLTALTATKIVAVSKIVLNRVKSELNSNARKAIQISNGIDIEKFRGKKKNRSEFTPKNQIIVGSIARQTNWKGIQWTAEAFIKLYSTNQNSRFHLVGAPADASDKILKILANIDSDSYLIDESIQNIGDFYNSIDIFVHVPIGTNDEAFGLVYIEALASGVKCIFTKSGVLNEIPEIENYASIVDFENSEEILEAILDISSEEFTERPSLPQEILEEYSLERMSKKYMQLLTNGRK